MNNKKLFRNNQGMIHQFQNKRNKKMVKVKIQFKEQFRLMMKIRLKLNLLKKQKSDLYFIKS